MLNSEWRVEYHKTREDDREKCLSKLFYRETLVREATALKSLSMAGTIGVHLTLSPQCVDVSFGLPILEIDLYTFQKKLILISCTDLKRIVSSLLPFTLLPPDIISIIIQYGWGVPFV